MKSGIYMIKCLSNGCRYIGSSKNITGRFSTHKSLLRSNKHHNAHFQNIWNKYGEKSLEFSVLEIVENQEDLIVREQYWIDTLSPEINKAMKAESGFLGRKHTTKTKEKLSKIATNRMKSPELREKLRQAAKLQNATQGNGMKGKHTPDNVKNKLRESANKQFSTKESREKHSEIMREWCTEEMRERISKSKTGSKRTKESIEKSKKSLLKSWENYSEEERKKRVEKTATATAKARAKTYHGFVSPSGEIYSDILNLAKFCREHGLSNPHMHNVHTGKKDNYMGWRKLD